MALKADETETVLIRNIEEKSAAELEPSDKMVVTNKEGTEIYTVSLSELKKFLGTE